MKNVIYFAATILISCGGGKENGMLSNKKDLTGYDSIQLFFQSRGVLTYNSSDSSLQNAIEILNLDGSSFAEINFKSGNIRFGNTIYSFDEFLNSEEIKSKYNFYPKEFYPDYYILQFEYLELKNNACSIFIDKKNELIKYVQIKNKNFKAAQWHKHFIGTSISFNKKKNPIRANPWSESKSLMFEETNQQFIFSIEQIQGEWIKVKCSEMCLSSCEDSSKFEGWIKWRDKDKLLIEFLYAC